MMVKDENQVEAVRKRLEAMKGEIRSASSAESARGKLNKAFELMSEFGLFEFSGDLFQAYMDNPSVQAEIQGGKSSAQAELSMIKAKFDELHTKLDKKIADSNKKLAAHYDVTNKHYGNFLTGSADQALISLTALLEERKDEKVVANINTYGQHKKLLLDKLTLIDEQEKCIKIANNGYIDQEITTKLQDRRVAVKAQIDEAKDNMAEHHTKLAVAQLSKEVVVGKAPVTEKNILEIQAFAQELDKSEQRNKIKQDFINLDANIVGALNDGKNFEKQSLALLKMHREELEAKRRIHASAISESSPSPLTEVPPPRSVPEKGDASNVTQDSKSTAAKPSKEEAPALKPLISRGNEAHTKSNTNGFDKSLAENTSLSPSKPIPAHIQRILSQTKPLDVNPSQDVVVLDSEKATTATKPPIPAHIQAILDKHKDHDPSSPPQAPNNGGKNGGAKGR